MMWSTNVENTLSRGNSFGLDPHFSQQNNHIPLKKMIIRTRRKHIFPTSSSRKQFFFFFFSVFFLFVLNITITLLNYFTKKVINSAIAPYIVSMRSTHLLNIFWQLLTQVKGIRFSVVNECVMYVKNFSCLNHFVYRFLEFIRLCRSWNSLTSEICIMQQW